MGASKVAYVSAYASSASATYTDATATLNVVAGDFLVAFYTANNPTNLVLAQDDGTDIFSTPVQIISANVPNPIYMAYLQVSANDASFRVRASHDNSLNWYRILGVYQFRPDTGETVTLDSISPQRTGTSMAALSGNADTSGTDEILVGVLGCTATTPVSERTIGGIATTEWLYVSRRQQSGYRFGTAPESAIALACTLTESDTWGACLVTFKSEAGGVSFLPIFKRKTNVLLRR